MQKLEISAISFLGFAYNICSSLISLPEINIGSKDVIFLKLTDNLMFYRG